MSQESIPDLSEMQVTVARAIDGLIGADLYLLQNDLNERSISHKLADQMQAAFPGWDVDCEYNRNLDQVKRLKELEEILGMTPPTDDQGRTVYPDIIVHKRGSTENLLVVEIKKSSSPVSENIDKEKIEAFIHTPELAYHYGVFIRLGVREEVGKYEWAWYSRT